MEKIIEYKLIGIGEFSHGIEESWKFRLNILKYAMKNTNKKINIFSEHSIWMAENIMNDTIYSREKNKFVKYNGIKKEEKIEGGVDGKTVYGHLWQYMAHSLESKIFIEIMKYIRKNRDRIRFIGTDNDKMDRDYDAYKIIMKNYNSNNINFYWAHNHHVDDMEYPMDNMRYIENKRHKWFCGHYLKRRLKEKYCIILSQAYEGENRFNGYCEGKDCERRTWQLKYIYKKFRYMELKKYVDKSKEYQLLENFKEKLIGFSNSYYKGRKNGVQSYDNNKSYNYILFWNRVNRLEPVYKY